MSESVTSSKLHGFLRSSFFFSVVFFLTITKNPVYTPLPPTISYIHKDHDTEVTPRPDWDRDGDERALLRSHSQLKRLQEAPVTQTSTEDVRTARWMRGDRVHREIKAL